MSDCKHNLGTYLSSLTKSLWGPGFGRFCKMCGTCVTHRGVEARPEEAEQARLLDRIDPDALPPIDEEALKSSVDKQMQKWIGPNGPFRRGLTRLE